MIVNLEKLENLLVANWTQFIDIRLLMNFVQNEAQKNIDSFINIQEKRSTINSNKISLSRFSPFKNGYIIWIEFNILLNEKIAEGTIEASFSNFDQKVELKSINGILIQRQHG